MDTKNMARVALVAGFAAGAYLMMSESTIVDDLSSAAKKTQKMIKHKMN